MTICHIQTQIAQHANASISADKEELTNDDAMVNLFVNGQADFSNGEIELYEVLDEALKDDKELFMSLVERMLAYDLVAQTELRQFVSAIAQQKNLGLAA